MPSQSLQKTKKHLCSIIASISVLSLVLILFTTTPLHSQEFRGSITGVVSDSTGGALPNAVVIVQNMDTQASFRTRTNSNGAYFAPSLAPGRYQIHIEAPNFKSFEQVGIILEASDNPQVNVTLQIGDVSQQVVVNADAPIVDASNAAISQVITTREVEDLPQNGRTPAVLAQLGVGVSSTNRPGQTRPFDNAGAAAIAIAGTHDESTEILLDGSPDTDNLLKLAYSPPQDIVQSVYVSAFQLDAAYGHSGGGVLNQITKSGTNTFHGSLYEYAQFAALNANGYFADRTNTPKANTHYNQYGLSIGGQSGSPSCSTVVTKSSSSSPGKASVTRSPQAASSRCLRTRSAQAIFPHCSTQARNTRSMTLRLQRSPAAS
jgi:hypothetical protein